MKIPVDRRQFLCASVASGATYALVGSESPSGIGQQPPPAPLPGANRGQQRMLPVRVRWHADFAAACAASEQSHKPVLLLQMMGRLDERLC